MTVVNTAFNPMVSIIIPVFNGADFLSQAIDSALEQTYNNIEVVVINDGSNDAGATARIAASYGDRIRYFEKPNGGVATALNMGMDKMVGAYFSWLSHDDLYVNEKIEQQIAFLSSLPSESRDRAVVYSDFYVFTNDPEKTIPVLMRGANPEAFRYWLTMESRIHGCTLMIPKTVLMEMGGFNEALRTTQDYDLWFRMAKNHPFLYASGFLVKSRSHANQGTVTMSDLVKLECSTLLSSFVENLTQQELLHASGQSLSVAYATIAANIWQRSHFKAGWLAARLSCKNLSKSFRTNAIVFRILSNGITEYCTTHDRMKPIKKYSPTRVYYHIKKCIAFGIKLVRKIIA